MNYYEHHIGDYDKNTSHLTACEDGIYSRLIRRYYDKEQPLPADVEQVKRLVRARDKQERKAVDDILAEFFELRTDGWHHKVCDAVLDAYRAGEPERMARKKNEETRLARHRDERAILFAVINAAGEHLAWNTSIHELRKAAERIQRGADSSSSTSNATNAPTPPATQPATAPATPATATHTPIPRHQTPDTSEVNKPRASRRVTSIWLTVDEMREGNDDLTAEVATEYLAYRRQKRAPLTKLAWSGIVSEIRTTKRPIERALAHAMSRGWTGFEAAWLEQMAVGGSRAAHRAAWLAELCGDQQPDRGERAHDGVFIDVQSRTVG